MNIQTYIVAITYYMALMGIGAVMLVEEIGSGFVVLMGLLILLSLAVNIRMRIVLPGVVWNLFAVVVFMVFIVDYLFISRTLVGAASRFLTILLVSKLFDLKTNRDYLMIYSIVFFQLLGAAASTVSPVFFLLLSLFVMGVIWAMIMFNIKRDCEEWSQLRYDTTRMVFGVQFFMGTIAITALSMVITLVLFFVIPRVGMGFFESKTLNTVKVSGFSEEVDIGSIGAVKKDPTVVMRVELPGLETPPPRLYFRGTALDYYDGTVWRRTLKKRTLLRDRKGSGHFVVGRPGKEGVIEQVILLEPLDTEVIFAIPYAVSLSGRFSNIWLDDSGAMYLPSPPYSRIEYRVYSSPAHGGWSYMGDEAFDRDSPYLSLPGGLEGRERLIELLTTITKGRTTDMDTARAIETYLRTNYRYTLNPRRGAGRTPLEDFLFFTREGYCEHYATAMVVLLRLAGIPSRIVTGFLQGEWNSFGNYLLVRQQDAHTWVEAYINTRGWMIFDPTPPAGVSAQKTSLVSLYLDSLRWRWTRYIIHYTSSDQRRLAMKIEGQVRRFVDSIRQGARLGDDLWEGMGWKVFAVVLATTAIVLAVIAGLRMFLKGFYSRYPKAPSFYIEMLEFLRKKGFERQGYETPWEFALRSGNHTVQEITRAYYTERYSGCRLDEEELQRIRGLLTCLKKTPFPTD